MPRINLEKDIKIKRLEDILDPLLGKFVRIKVSYPKQSFIFLGHIVKNSKKDYVLEGISRGNRHYPNLTKHYQDQTESLFKDNSSIEILY